MCTAALLRLLAPPRGKNYLDRIKMLLQRKQALASWRRLTSVMPCRCRLGATPTRCSLLWKTLEAWVTFTNTDKSSRWFRFWHHTVHRTSGRESECFRLLPLFLLLLHFPESPTSNTATSAETISSCSKTDFGSRLLKSVTSEFPDDKRLYLSDCWWFVSRSVYQLHTVNLHPNDANLCFFTWGSSLCLITTLW